MNPPVAILNLGQDTQTVPTSRPPWAVPDSDMAHLDPAVLEAYRQVANHHPNPEVAKALFVAATLREAEIRRQMEDLRHRNEILKRDQLTRRSKERLRHEERAREIDMQEERAQKKSMTTHPKFILKTNIFS